MKVALVLLLVLVFGTIAASAHREHFGGHAVWYRDDAGACGVPLVGPYAAHRTLPCGSRVRVRHEGRSVVVTIRDRGPYGSAVLDLAPRAFRRLAPLSAGRISIRAVVLRRGW